MYLYGNVRLNDDLFPNWATAPGAHTGSIGGVSLPQIGVSYWNARWSGATDLAEQGSSGKYVLAGGATPAYFRTAAGSNPFSIYENHNDPEIIVTGTCVWMLDRGMRFDGRLHVTGTSSDRLVIVAREVTSTPYDPPPADFGINFFSGIDSPDVPIVLVSDSRVRIEHGQFTSSSGTVNAISIFARSVFLLGPDPSSVDGQVLRHDPSMDTVIDELIQNNVLPNFTSGLSSAFNPIPGTWRELDPDNPS
jgi:hypothetical protein